MATPTFLYCSLLAIIFFTHSSSAQQNHLTLELIHRDSPRSPLYNPAHTASDRLNAAILRSISRSDNFNYTISSGTDLQSDIIGHDGEYFMSIWIGTPPTKILAIADTGSDLTWIQCQPCQHCYKQNGPIFNKNKSSTYKNELCDSKTCNAFSRYREECFGSSSVCKYQNAYGDESLTKGDIATETISINSSLGSLVSFPNTSFGCGHENRGIYPEAGTGIIGLGGGSVSLISQLGSYTGNKFSYCLSNTPFTKNSKSVINLGITSIDKDTGVITTPLIDKEPDTFYYVTLEAISVGKTKIPCTRPSYSSRPGSPSTGNIIIDSGTTFTLLEREFYHKIAAVVEKSVTGGKRVNDPSGLLPHCFKKGKTEIGMPEITMHFNGGDLKLSRRNAFEKITRDIECFSMIPTTRIPIFGNLGQMNFLVGFDLETRTVSFQPMDCSASAGNL